MNCSKILSVFSFLVLSGLAATLQAQTITSGVYKMNDGKISGSFTVAGIGNGKFMFEGGSKTPSGAECMLNGPGSLNGNELEIGYKCSIKISASDSQIIIDDYKKCIPCDPGAYISGTYKRQ